MIQIVNVSEDVQPTGTHLYELRVNRNALTTFNHNREDGIATLLRLAADAIETTRATADMKCEPFKWMMRELCNATFIDVTPKD